MQYLLCQEKKNPANSPNYYYYFLLKKCNMELTSMQGKIKLDDANTEKQSLDLLFLSSPINTCKDLS
jgi:hypothetical protein